jgi:calmodulin
VSRYTLIIIICDQPPSAEEVDEVLKELDENGDGKLSIDEF